MRMLYDTRTVHPLDRYDYYRAGAASETAPVEVYGRPRDHLRRSRVRARRARVRFRPGKLGGGNTVPKLSRPHRLTLQIGVTLTLPRRLGWLLAGIAIGRNRMPDGLSGRVNPIVEALFGYLTRS